MAEGHEWVILIVPRVRKANVPRLTSFQTQGSIPKCVSRALLYEIWKLLQLLSVTKMNGNLQNLLTFQVKFPALRSTSYHFSLWSNLSPIFKLFPDNYFLILYIFCQFKYKISTFSWSFLILLKFQFSFQYANTDLGLGSWPALIYVMSIVVLARRLGIRSHRWLLERDLKITL